MHSTSSKVVTQVFKGLTERDDGVYIHGLFLYAGRIDLVSKCLVDPIPGNYYQIQSSNLIYVNLLFYYLNVDITFAEFSILIYVV